MTEEEKVALSKEFHGAMIDICRRAHRECKYVAHYFMGMVGEHGGLEAAKILLHAPNAQSGLERLRELGRLDISMERIVVEPRFAPLFTMEERRVARNRLVDMGYPREKL